MEVKVEGLWTGKAGAVDPKPQISAETKTSRFFYRFLTGVEDVVKTIVYVYVDGKKILAEMQDFKPKDGIDTGFFDVPMSMRVPGLHNVVVEVYEWTVEPEQKTFIAKAGFEIVYE